MGQGMGGCKEKNKKKKKQDKFQIMVCAIKCIEEIETLGGQGDRGTDFNCCSWKTFMRRLH